MSRTFERVGHGGASALVRANTLASFDAALEIGVDTIEFDVRAWRGELVLAHTMLHARACANENVRLVAALAHLASPRFSDLGLVVDLKHGGVEAAVLAELRGAGLLERALLTSQVTDVLDRIRALDPSARTGISVGGRVARAGHRWRDWRARVLTGLADHRWDALMAQHRLIDSSLAEEVAVRGAALYAWTVNDRGAIAALRTLGIDGVVTADPRLFAA